MNWKKLIKKTVLVVNLFMWFLDIHSIYINLFNEFLLCLKVSEQKNNNRNVLFVVL